uniref:Uncharacterized protein n=1 Tax=viral metagenome TaxID=1070528 RepID=A0A6C0AK39_9ZZZZ
MDEWVTAVRDLKDSAPDAYEVEVICRDILRYVRTKRIRDTGKFIQHLGPEYEAFLASLKAHDEEMVEQIVREDAFWNATLAFLPKTNTLHRTV